MTTRLATIVLASALAGAAALAHTGATGIVLERMEGMKAMGDAVRAVAPMMRGEADYDAAALRRAAETIEAHSGAALAALFPKGSNGAPSEALDRIWDEWETFAALADRMETAARGLAIAADNGLGRAPGAMPAGNMMGGNMMGPDTMMDGGAMMGGDGGTMSGAAAVGGMTAEAVGSMPADAAFAMTSRLCSACHTRFRAESD